MSEFYECFHEAVAGRRDEAELIAMIRSGEHDLTDSPLLHQDDGRTYLALAVQYGRTDTVHALIACGVDVGLRDPLTNQTPLHCLVTKKNKVLATPALLLFLRDHGADLDAWDDAMRTPLVALLDTMKDDDDEARGPKEALAEHLIGLCRLDDVYGAAALAAAIPSRRVCELLLEKGVSINGVARQGHPPHRTSPLTRAVKDRNVDAVTWLLSRGASAEGRVGDSCMVHVLDKHTSDASSEARQDEVAALLLSHGASATAAARVEANRSLFKMLSFRADPDPEEAMRVLARGDIDVNVPPHKSGKTLLHFAAGSGFAEVMAELITRGADVNAMCTEGDTPLHVLMRDEPNVSNAKLLLDAGANANLKNQLGETPIQRLSYSPYAAPDRVAALVKTLGFLLERGADVSGMGGRRLLCSLADHTEAALMLVRGGVEPRGRGKPSPLLAAASHGNAELYFHLASKGFDTQTEPLRIAASALAEKKREAERGQIFDSVLPRIADLNQPVDSVGNRLLNYCATGDLDEVARHLIARGADLALANKNELAPLDQALIYKNYATAKVLMEAGANLKGERGADCFSIAIHNKSAAGVKLLIEHGAEVNAIHGGLTPLQLAAKTSQNPVVRLLLEAGANPNLRGDSEPYPLALSIKKANEVVMHLLLVHGADPTLPIDKKATLATLAAKSRNPAIAGMVALSREELETFKPHQKLLRFNRKRALFASGVTTWTEAIRAQMKANFGKRTAESIQEEMGEIEYFDVEDESGKPTYQLMLFNYGDGCLFNHGKKTVVGHIVQHGFNLQKKLAEDAEADLREKLDEAYRSFDGEIRQSVDFTK